MSNCTVWIFNYLSIIAAKMSLFGPGSRASLWRTVSRMLLRQWQTKVSLSSLWKTLKQIYSRNVRPQVETLVQVQILSPSDLLILRATEVHFKCGIVIKSHPTCDLDHHIYNHFWVVTLHWGIMGDLRRCWRVKNLFLAWYWSSSDWRY